MALSPQSGELFAARYRVERVLGTGGMGVVLAAWDEKEARGVALKLLQVTDATSVERFQREARAMRKIASAHVVRVLDDGVDDGAPYLVMERLSGANLSEYAKARGGTLSPREAADIVIQACEALAHAHAAGIVHRDVKPSNLYLHDGQGAQVVKVLDFGISKQLTREEWEKTLTAGAESGVLGSPPYMSPEHVRDPRRVDLRTDIWALGVLLHKLSTGALPFDGESVGEVFAKVLDAEPPAMTNLPPRLAAVIRRCLSRDRSQRYPSTRALADDLAPLASETGRAMVASIPLVTAADDEPHTLTVDRPVPAPAPAPLGSAPLVVPTPSSLTPPASVVPVAPARSRRLLAAGLGVVGIAVGVGIGLAIRKPTSTSIASGGAAATASAEPAAPMSEARPTTSARVSVQEPSPASVPIVEPSAVVAPKPLTSSPSSTASSSAPAPSAPPKRPPRAKPPARPELQDNPYK